MQKICPSLAAVFLFLIAAGVGWADEPEAVERDVLVFKDGDRVHGRLVSRQGEMLVFRSDRFGEMRVPASGAVVIKGEKEPAPPLRAGPAGAVVMSPAVADHASPIAAGAEKRAESEHVSMLDWFSPAVLTARFREFFGPWHGRLAFSTEVVADNADRNSLSAEIRLKRKWKRDEVQLGGRLEYSKTNLLTTTDMIKADGSWRHDFKKKSFAVYRPTLEWNRANFRGGLPADYVLLQQEIGAGVNILAHPARKVRMGVSENLFDVWNMEPVNTHSSRTVESAFVETELRLPWQMSLAERGVYYYSFSSQDDGWENRVELNKRFTETLSAAIRHEIREGSPDGTAQDYTRLKLLLGLDF